MPPPRPRAWSVTLGKTLEACSRKYYYQYHLARAGAKDNAPRRARDAHVCRNVVGPEAWAGDVVHDAIQRCLDRWRSGIQWTEEMVMSDMRLRMKNRLRDSYDYLYRDREAFPRTPQLLDLHYFNQKWTPDRRDQVQDLVDTSFRNFLASDLADRIRRAGPNSWRPIDRNASVQMEDGILLRVKPDFAFEDGNLLRVLDWKTGKADTRWENVQVTCYSLFAAEHWRRPREQIRTACVHLYPKFDEMAHDQGPAIRALVRNMVTEQLSQIERLEAGSDGPEEENFPLTEDRRKCRWCSYRGICPGGQEAGATTDDLIPLEPGM